VASEWMGATSGLASVVRKLKTKCCPHRAPPSVPWSSSHSRQMPAKNISGRVSSRANHVQIDFEPWFLSGSPKLIAGMRHRYSG
jgi:hypothetical protein